MLRWIERTRKKPKIVRDQYAFVGAVAVTSLIALVWLVSLPTHFANMEVEGEAEKEAIGAFSRFMRDARSNIATVFSSTDTEEAATSSEERASSTELHVPDLSEENINMLKEKQVEANRPASRTVLIATTSRASTTESASSSQAAE